MKGAVGNSIGHTKSYATAGVLGLVQGKNSCFQPFVDLRGHALGSDQWAANAGVGCRYDLSSYGVGANAFYDYRQECGALHQAGGGIEFFIPWACLSFNAYLPFGKKLSVCPHSYEYEGGYLVTCSSTMKALAGCDVGMRLKSLNIGRESDVWCHAAFGGYFYEQKKGKNVLGGRVCAELSYLDFFRLAVEATSDAIFGNNLRGIILISLPFDERGIGVRKRGGSQDSLRLGCIPVSRQETIVLSNPSCCWMTNY